QIPNETGTKSLTPQSISNWERGLDQPKLTIKQVKALCKALGMKLEDLPDDFGPPHKTSQTKSHE
ncbi:MAG TPA: helix-turn-helix transcriptional regulator, partial [Allocoleopsis sp.]